MIVNNRLIFGYGDIGVGFNNQGLYFTQLKPPAEIGTTLNLEYCDRYGIEFGKEYYMPLEFSEINELKDKLNDVTEANCVFEFKKFMFDFTKYNEGSINVVKGKLENLPLMYLLPYAC